MKRILLVFLSTAAVAMLVGAFYAGNLASMSNSTPQRGVTSASTSEVSRASCNEVVPEVSPVAHPTERQFEEPLPGLAAVLSSIPDEDQRRELEFSIECYREAVADYKESLQQLPPPVGKALLAGDEDAIAMAAAEDPTIIDKVVTIQRCYTDAAKARGAVTAAITVIGNPTLAAEIYRILAIIDSDMPDAEKFRKILEVIVRRLLFLLKAMAAAKTGSVSSDLIGGGAEDLDVVRGAFTRLVTDGNDGGGSSLEAYLTDGTQIDFRLPDDMDLQRLQDLANSSNSIEFSVEDGLPTLRIVSPSGELLLHISQSNEGPALIVIDQST